METIGEKIRKLRKQKGFSQEELAFRVGVTRQTISKWESDSMNPNMDSIRALCEIFNVNADYFFIKFSENIETQSDVNTEIAATNEIDRRIKPIKWLIVNCIIMSILFIISLVGTIIIAFSALTSNKGDSIYRTPEIDFWVFFVFVGISCVLLLIDIVLIITIFKRKNKCKELVTECKQK